MLYDLLFGGFVLLLMAIGLRRPFMLVLLYLYVDIVSPQKISWGLLSAVPLSLVAFLAAFGGWLVLDNKEGTRFTFRQLLLLLLLIWCGVTTMSADFPEPAALKWDWVWKALLFALFLPLTLRTRLRVEAAALFMVLAAGAIIISGAIKTLASGGGYGSLKFFVNDNSGLYEGSTLSMVAIAIIPIVYWLSRHGTIFKPGKLTGLYAAALIFACALIPIGTQTRTGLLCLGLLCLLTLRSVRRRFLYIGLIGALGLVAVPFLPDSYTKRMNTLENVQGDRSASTRMAVWAWTFDYAKDNPLGGGFDSYLGNRIRYQTSQHDAAGNNVEIETDLVEDKARAFHSAYFEMLGEQGWPGLIIWLLLHVTGLIQLELVRYRLRGKADPQDISDRSLANALQQSYLIYLAGALFVGIAYQPFVYMLIGLQIGLVSLIQRRLKPPLPRRAPRPAPGSLRPAGPEPVR